VRTALAALVVLMTLLPPGGAADADFADFAFHPHPGAQLPLGLNFTDEDGRAATLRQFFTGKPVVLVLDYLRCKTLCGLTLENLAAALDAVSLDAGRDFQIVAISIDPRDNPADLAAAKTKYLTAYHHAKSNYGWHFLGGPQPAVQRVADTIGFPYRYEPALDQYIHPAGFVIAAPDGSISRYLPGVSMQPADLRAALSDAAQGRTIGLVTRLLLLCHGDTPQRGRYSLAIDGAFIVANLSAMIGGIALFAAIRRRRHG
jgi:protein SCO1/2